MPVLANLHSLHNFVTLERIEIARFVLTGVPSERKREKCEGFCCQFRPGPHARIKTPGQYKTRCLIANGMSLS